MQFLITTLAYYPYIGGHAVATAGVAEELVQKGHKVSIFTSNLTQFSPLRKIKAGPDQVNGIPVFRFNSVWPDMSKKSNFGSAFTTLIDNLSLLDEKHSCLQNPFFLMRTLSFPFTPQMLLWGLANEVYADVIHAFDLVWSTSFISYVLAKRKRLPYVITPFLHTYSARHRGNSLLKVLKGADAIIAVTKSEQKFIVEKGVPDEKVHTIGIGVDVKKLRGGNGTIFRIKHNISQEEPIVLFVGRKEVDKGIVQLLRAMALIWSRMPNASLVIIGSEGILPNDTRRYYDTLSLVPSRNRQKIFDLGVVSENEKLDALSAADILVVPSRRDSFGIVYLEAWSYHKPVVGARCAPIWDTIDDGVNGMLVDFGDEKDLANCLLRLLGDEGLREELGERGYEKVTSNYTSEITVNKLEKVYMQI